MRTLKTILLLAGMAVAAPSMAIQDTWSLTTNVAAGSGTACITQACKTTFAAGNGDVLTVKAYSTQTLATTNAVPVSTGNWIEAQIAVYGAAGAAVANLVQPTATEVNNAPQHAMDNYGVHDIMVLDFGTLATWDTVSFTIGWLSAINADGTTGSGTGPIKLQAWMGGAGLATNYDFRQVCFTGCSNSNNNIIGGTLGFTDVTGNLAAVAPDTSSFAGGVLTVTGAADVIVNSNGTALGRYMIIAPALNDSTSAFKIDSVIATKSTTSVPVPGSLPLLGLGLLALTATMRRRISARAA